MNCYLAASRFCWTPPPHCSDCQKKCHDPYSLGQTSSTLPKCNLAISPILWTLYMSFPSGSLTLLKVTWRCYPSLVMLPKCSRVGMVNQQMLHQHDTPLPTAPLYEELMKQFWPCTILNSMNNRDPFMPILCWVRSKQERWFYRWRTFILRMFCYLSRRLGSGHVNNIWNDKTTFLLFIWVCHFSITNGKSAQILALLISICRRKWTKN